jgi:hypothetical protein
MAIEMWFVAACGVVWVLQAALLWRLGMQCGQCGQRRKEHVAREKSLKLELKVVQDSQR